MSAGWKLKVAGFVQ
jgi:hypothetical protein